MNIDKKYFKKFLGYERKALFYWHSGPLVMGEIKGPKPRNSGLGLEKACEGLFAPAEHSKLTVEELVPGRSLIRDLVIV